MVAFHLNKMSNKNLKKPGSKNRTIQMRRSSLVMLKASNLSIYEIFSEYYETKLVHNQVDLLHITTYMFQF